MKHAFFTLLMLLLAHSLMAQDIADPMPDEAAVVVAGKARFTVLTPRMIRIQYSSKSLFEDRASFAVINRRLPVPEFTQEERDGYLYITTSELELKYKMGSAIRNNYVNSDNLRITFRMNGKQVLWYQGKDDAMNLWGTGRTMDGNIGDTQRQDLEKGLLSRAGWAVINESPSFERGDGSRSFVFDEAVDGIPWVAEPVDATAVDWYFMGYGHDYKAALSDYVKIAGRQPLPPYYMFGYWYSKYQAYSSNDYTTLVREMEDNNVPHDVLMFDMDWHTSGWTGWTWNKQLIANPKQLINWMHNHNLKIALNLHPADGVGTSDEGYAAICRDMGQAAGSPVPWQLENSTFYRSLFKNIIRVRENEGVDFWWLDWQQDKTSQFMPGLGNTFWLNHVFYNDMKHNRPDRRPVIFHRWGGLGSHRYPLGFSGDTFATYGTLDFESYWTATAANVGFGYWGHDGGGYLQPGDQTPTDPELMLRWMQFAVFQPIFRTHGSSQGVSERRVWKFSDYNLIQQSFNLRYELIPYIYTAARKSYDTGVSICRPLYYEWPEENKAYSIENEYMFGEDILVAPVATPSDNDDRSLRKTWLPEGKWFDATRGRLIEGNCEVTDRYSLTEIPYFIRQGSIIPRYPLQQNLKTRTDQLVFQLVPGADGSCEVYEDDGDSEAYQKDGFARMKVEQHRTETTLNIALSAWEGTYEGMIGRRTYTLQLLASDKPTEVRLNGELLVTWAYDEVTRMVNIQLPEMDVNTSAEVQVEVVDADAIDTAEYGNLQLEYDADRMMLTAKAGEKVSKLLLKVVAEDGTVAVKAETADADELDVQLANLPKGIYVCSANADGKVLTRKIMK